MTKDRVKRIKITDINSKKLAGPSSASWNQAKHIGKRYTLLIPDAYRTRKEIAGVMGRLLSDIGSLGDRFVVPLRYPVTAAYDMPLPSGKRLKGSVLIPEYSIHEVGYKR